MLILVGVRIMGQDIVGEDEVIIILRVLKDADFDAITEDKEQ